MRQPDAAAPLPRPVAAARRKAAGAAPARRGRPPKTEAKAAGETRDLSQSDPAKFKESVEAILAKTLPLPAALAERADLALLSHYFAPDFAQLRKFLMELPH